MLEKFLQDVGLNEKEAKVYLYLVAVDHASVLDIAKKTLIKRPTVYTTLESLSKKGLVSETTVGKKTHYQAEPPERLETYVERRKLELDEQSKRLKDIVPQIKSVQRESGEKPVVKFFEGKEGVSSANAELFKDVDAGETAYFVYPKDLVNEVFSDAERNVYKASRVNNNIKSKTICTSTKYPVTSNDMADRLRIDSEKYKLSCDITVLADKVRIVTLGKSPDAIFIKSKDFSETLKTVFQLAFEEAKRKPSK
ncbi:MAG: hypothetical protein RLZZ347_818 [Candidatus Parcubacteria bacterium]|jgi:sugar-specific transcriptional regulator TrmB